MSHVPDVRHFFASWRRIPREPGLLLASVLAVTCSASTRAQVVPSRFATGDRDLVSLTFGNMTATTLAAALTVQSGALRPVVHLGQPMLRVGERTALLVHLPEVLPQDFTLEFDIVPKTCCMPEDLAVEGTRTIDQGTTSANVLWHRDQLIVIGGASDNYHGKVPEPLASTVPGNLTQIVLIVQGDNMTLLTNGQQLFSLTNRKFARNNFLRVFLGGQNDTDRAVYLARMRVIANSPVGPLAGGTPPASFSSVSSRSISLAGFAATETTLAVASRTLPLTGFAAAGTAPVASRTLSLAGFTAAGLAVLVSSRTITLAGFAAGGAAAIASRAIALAGFTADGFAATIASRTITLAGFRADGAASSVASRTITLAGWTAAGPP